MASPNDDWEDVRQGIEAYRQYKETKQDLGLRWKRLTQDIELDRLERLQKLSVDVLILAAQSPEQAHLLHNLARLDRLKGMSTDRVLAVILEGKPELAGAIKEILIKMQESGNLKAYEELVSTLKTQLESNSNDYKYTLDKFANMFEKSTDAGVNIARAAAGMGRQQAGISCRNCGAPAPQGANFCQHCGARLQP